MGGRAYINLTLVCMVLMLSRRLIEICKSHHRDPCLDLPHTAAVTCTCCFSRTKAQSREYLATDAGCVEGARKVAAPGGVDPGIHPSPPQSPHPQCLGSAVSNALGLAEPGTEYMRTYPCPLHIHRLHGPRLGRVQGGVLLSFLTPKPLLHEACSQPRSGISGHLVFLLFFLLAQDIDTRLLPLRPSAPLSTGWSCGWSCGWKLDSGLAVLGEEVRAYRIFFSAVYALCQPPIQCITSHTTTYSLVCR
jgi:hypothetical protein